MSAELARRLIHREAAPAQVEAAQFEAVERGVSLVLVVMERYPELVLLLERALERVDVPALHSVRPLAELTLALPAGMCQRLLALPVRGDPQTESVDVASVDVLDVHVAREFAFQPNMPVRILRAPLQEMARALAGLATPPAFSQGHPPRPRTVARELLTLCISKSRILRSNQCLAWAARSRFRGPDPSSAGRPGRSSSKQRSPRWTALRPPNKSCRGSVRACARCPHSSSQCAPISSRCAAVVQRLPMLPSCARSAPTGNGNLLDAAARAGFYFGPFAQLLALLSLAGKWAVAPGSDCYARVVYVAERPSLIVVMAGFTPSGVPKRFTESTEATGRADVLAQSASRALERILRSRKRG